MSIPWLRQEFVNDSPDAVLVKLFEEAVIFSDGRDLKLIWIDPVYFAMAVERDSDILEIVHQTMSNQCHVILYRGGKTTHIAGEEYEDDEDDGGHEFGSEDDLLV